MWQYAAKVILTSIVVVAVSEIAKRSTFWGAALASLPLTSVLAFVWLWTDTGDPQRIISLSHGIFWLVLPSLTLFLLLPVLLRAGAGFWPGLGASCVATAAMYFAMVWCLGKAGVPL